jgi:hypothetical protein
MRRSLYFAELVGARRRQFSRAHRLQKCRRAHSAHILEEPAPAPATNTGTMATDLNTSSTSFVVDFGGGVERKITDRLALRGDLRYFFGGDLVPDYWRLGGGLRIDMGRH